MRHLDIVDDDRPLGKITVAEAKRLIEEEGWIRSEVADYAGVSRQAFDFALGPQTPQSWHDDARALFKLGCTRGEIAEILGVGRMYVGAVVGHRNTRPPLEKWTKGNPRR